MRLQILSGGIFWGSILILLGVSIIVKVVFHVNIPIFRVAFALLLIFLGVKLLTGFSFFEKYQGTIIFEKKSVLFDNNTKEYNTIFAKGEYDFSSIKPGLSSEKIQINTIFAESQLILNSQIPTFVRVNSVFALSKIPDGSSVSFGEMIYKTPSFKADSPALYINVNVIFGGLEIFENWRN